MSKLAYIGKDLIEKGKNFVVAKVVDTKGSTPRKKGACLIMEEDGNRHGTVGGGKLEAEVERICLETFKTKENKIHHFRLTPKDQQGLDMRCGGDADVSIEYIDASKPESFIAEFDPKTTAYIFGAGHVGLALEPILRYVNFTTVVIDDRAEFSNTERFPEAEKVIVIEDYKDAFGQIKTDDNSFIVIVTRGHSGDYDVLKQALALPNAYIGMIGSKTKVKAVYKMLEEDGFTKEQLEKVYSPVGTDIFAETPEEIAISIAGEMIMVRSGNGTR